VAQARLAAVGIPIPKRLVSAELVTRGKPHPEPFLTGAALLGFAPQDCVVFEDSSSGAKAGRAAGCTVVATTFSHPVETLAAAHYLVTDLSGIEVTRLQGKERLTLNFTPLAR
jgi:sugar-phosphatase